MDKISSAVIGLGNIGFLYDLEGRIHPASHAMGYIMDADFDLKHAIEPDTSKWVLIEKYVEDCEYYKSIDEFIKNHSNEKIGVVSICTPPSYHLSIIRKLLDSRICKVIFCEKPIVNDLDEVAVIRDAVSNCEDILVIPNISRRWSTGLSNVCMFVQSGELGMLKKINGRYTRGIYNTGSHLFDLIYMVSGSRIAEVIALGETPTTAVPERSFSFFFRDEKGMPGYFEAIDDRDYYMFEVDFYFDRGKVEFRVSGDELLIYQCKEHHLFKDKTELVLYDKKKNMLKESHIKNALNEIKQVIRYNKAPSVSVEDAIYPLYVAEAIERSSESGRFERVMYKM